MTQFTDAQLKAAAQRPSWCMTYEADRMCPNLAKAVLVEREATAARVIELEAENKRLRERLNTIRALAAKSQNEGGPNFDLEIIEGFAIAALEGGMS